MSPRVSDGGAGRVIAGTARGLRLDAPGDVTRPLSDRVKEALFAILEPDLRDRRVLDLFAGSGAAGIEALSRGAGVATFVERDRKAIAVIRANVDRSRLGGTAARIVESDVLRWLRSGLASQDGAWDVVIIDPPYDKPDLLISALEILGGESALVSASGVVVAKHFWRDQPPERIGLLASDRARRFGDTALTFYRVVQPAEAQL